MKEIHIAQPSTGKEEWEALLAPLETGWLTQGPKVAEFEKNFVALNGSQYALATTSCTTALHLILAAMGIGPGDEVIVPAFSWIATANAVLYTGAQPIFVDIDPFSYNLDPVLLSAKLTSKTRAILTVHLFGLCSDVKEIEKIVGNIPIIEDAACAVGARLRGKSAGTLGLAGAFSFHPRKIITTGEGGMVTTNDRALAEKMKTLRSHGGSLSEEQRHRGPRPYELPEFSEMGFNYRMTDLQAAMGVEQLKRLSGLLNDRKKGADFYFRNLAGIPGLQLPTVPPDFEHSWQSFVCRVLPGSSPLSRDAILQKLLEEKIHARGGTHSIPHQQFYRARFGFKDQDFPESLACQNQTLALPLHSKMDTEDFSRVVSTVRRLFAAQV